MVEGCCRERSRAFPDCQVLGKIRGYQNAIEGSDEVLRLFAEADAMLPSDKFKLSNGN